MKNERSAFQFLCVLFLLLPLLVSAQSIDVDRGFDAGALRRTGGAVTGPVVGTTASFSLNVEARNLTMNGGQVASQSYVDVTHGQDNSAQHGATTIASQTYVDVDHGQDNSAIHGCTAVASATYVQEYVASQKTASQGNVLVASTASSSIVLPIDGALTEVDSASGSACMFEFYLMGLQSPTLSVYSARITGVAENYDDTLAILDAQTKTETGWNHTLFGSYVDATGNALRVIASGPANTTWQVKETKYFELGD